MLEGGNLSEMQISADTIIQRDEFVFSLCVNKYQVPIMMLLGGGLEERNAAAIACSIKNLKDKRLIFTEV